jgi:hypothetical protein
MTWSRAGPVRKHEPGPYHSNPDWRVTMGSSTTPKPIIVLDIETLNLVAERLAERADAVRQVTLADWAEDLRIAARACGLLAHIRFELGEISTKTKDHDTRLELRGLLDDAARAEPGVGQA